MAVAVSAAAQVAEVVVATVESDMVVVGCVEGGVKEAPEEEAETGLERQALPVAVVASVVVVRDGKAVVAERVAELVVMVG